LKCKKLARHYEQEFKDVWGKEEWEAGRKEEVMKKALIYKFKQNPELLNRLMDTGDSVLVEASDKDPYWGGLMPNSKNRLGLCLMELRGNYKKTNSLLY
jgi:ribA/ribD-fused uncharacterized protein